MQASDIMTTNVITVHAETEVKEIAALLLKHRISAVPVVSDGGKVIGLVSEGDLVRRAENDTDHRHAWWIADFFSSRDRTADYIKSHARQASDVMTSSVISVAEDTPIHEIASLLERKHIKRVPVMRDSKLVGIVSRANLLHGLAAAQGDATSARTPNDKDLRDKIMKELEAAIGDEAPFVNAIVKNGAVQLWGIAYDHANRKAAQLAAEGTPGVKSVDNHIGLVPSWSAEE